MGIAKPDHAAFQFVADLYGVPMNRLLHIGDDWECDVLGALSVGASATWISRGRGVPSFVGSYQNRLLVALDLPTAAARVRECIT